MCQCWAKILCAVVVIISVNSVTCVPHQNYLANMLDFGFTRNKADNFEKCIMDANYTCLEELVRSKVNNLLDSDEFEVMEDVVIEKVSDNSSDSQNAKSGSSRLGKKSGLYRKVKNFFTSRALRVDFLDVLRLRMSKAANFPEEVELSVELVPESGRTKLDAKGGKGHRTAKIVVPLVIGFITTGLGILAIATVKAILMKAFFVSTIAAFTALFLVVKKALASKSTPEQQPYYFAPYPIPYETAYHPSELSFGTAYNSLNHYATINPTELPWATQYAAAENGYGGYSGKEHDTGSSAGLEGTDEDSQGQYSNVRSATVQSTASKMKRKSGTAGAFRGMIKLVKSQANRLPVLAYRHTGTGRKLA